MMTHRIAIVLTSAAALAACGGGSTGTGLAIAPPPPPAPAPTPAPTSSFIGFVETSRTALPATPANTTGVYSGPAFYTSAAADDSGHLVSTQSMQVVQNGAATLVIDAATRTYTLTLAVAPEASSPATMTLPANSPLGFRVVYVERYSDGSTRPGSTAERTDSVIDGGVTQAIANGEALGEVMAAGTYPDGSLRAQNTFVRLYNVGHTAGRPRYLSYGGWAQTFMARGADDRFHPVTQSIGGMVFGQRTAAGDMPLTGTATYTLQSLIGGDYYIGDEFNNGAYFVDVDGDTSLTVDFASKQLSAVHDQLRTGETFQTDENGDYVLDGDGYPVVSGNGTTMLHATGSTILSGTNDFTLALNGLATTSSVPLVGAAPPDQTQTVSGLIVGALYGPQAAEVGGIWTLPIVTADGAVSPVTTPFFGLPE